jgi:CHAD domain-containing protein
MADGKWIDGLTPHMPVADAARVILTLRFGIVRTTLPAAVERPAEDVEHVHQLRVGTRRAGAALKLLGSCLADKWLVRAKKTLKHFRRAAGDARDWDVFILGLAGNRTLTAASGKPALDFLLGYALRERTAAQRHLVDAADHDRVEFEELCDQLPTALNDGSQTLGELAEKEIGDLFAEFNDAVTANPADAADLHQLRIKAKRVRYAMELFVGCFAPEFRNVLYPEVEKVQEVLGSLQDATVGVERLESLRTNVQQMMPLEWKRLQPPFSCTS